MKRLSALATTVVLLAGACGDDSEAEDTTDDAIEDVTDNEEGLTEDEPAEGQPTGGDPGEVPPPRGERIEVSDAEATRTIDCAGGSVLIEGDSNEITLTGECADVYVTGDHNNLSAAHADLVDIRGENNSSDVQMAENVQVVGNDNTVIVTQAGTILLPGHRNEVSAEEVRTLFTLGSEASATIGQVGTIVTSGTENDVTWSAGTFGSEPRVYDYGLSNLVRTANL